MQINNNSQINFNGTFHLTKLSPEVKSKLPDVMNRYRQFFYDIKGADDVYIVVRNGYDKKFTDFIEQNCKENFNCYYPAVSTQSGLDDEKPLDFVQVLKEHSDGIITKFDEVKKWVMLPTDLRNLAPQIEMMKTAIKTLGLDVKNPKLSLSKKTGQLMIRDEDKKRTIKSSSFYDSVAYISVEPDSFAQKASYYRVEENGTKVAKKYETPDEITKFKQLSR